MPGISNNLGAVDVLLLGAAVAILCGFLAAVAFVLAREDRWISRTAHGDSAERWGDRAAWRRRGFGPATRPLQIPSLHRGCRGHACLSCSEYGVQADVRMVARYAAGAASLRGPT
jgi:hypothetical protein